MRAGDGGGDGERVRARNGEGAGEGAGGSDGWQTRAKGERQHRMANARKRIENKGARNKEGRGTNWREGERKAPAANS